MLRTMLRAKIAGLTVTDKQLYYKGSITLDASLLEKADILPGEQVEVLNLNNGERFSTYTIKGKRGSGCAVLNGPAARLGEVGDKIMVLCYGLVDTAEAPKVKARVVGVDERNRQKRG